VALLQDPVPGVRRAAAWSLGWHARGAALAALWSAARRERCDQVRVAMAVGAVRCGAEPARAWALLRDAASRQIATFYGRRQIAEAVEAGVDAVARRWLRTLALDAPPGSSPADVSVRDPRELRVELHRRLDADPEDRRSLLQLALLQHPEDHERIVGRKWVSGRRESHAICEALGEHGDPRGCATLVRELRAVNVDPGHGFAGRRASATALGRIGDPSVGAVLARALVDEARDFEGTPGAGMGIQFPVRSVILVAVGEAGCVDQAPLLASYLGDVHGSALGGFYLPAMDALWKLGKPEVLGPVLRAGELPAANAVGVLAAMGEVARVRALVGDPRPRVAETARLGLELLA